MSVCRLLRLFREIFTQIRERRAVPIGPDDEEDDDENGEDWEYGV